MAKKKATKKTDQPAKPGKSSKPIKSTPKASKAETRKPKVGKPKTGNTHKTSAEPTHEQIAQKAYDIWLSKGRPMGQDDANWAEAVAALKG